MIQAKNNLLPKVKKLVYKIRSREVEAKKLGERKLKIPTGKKASSFSAGGLLTWPHIITFIFKKQLTLEP